MTVTADGMAVSGAICGNTGSYTWNNGWTKEPIIVELGDTTTADHPATANGTDTASATHTSQNRAAIVALSLSVYR